MEALAEQLMSQGGITAGIVGVLLWYFHTTQKQQLEREKQMTARIQSLEEWTRTKLVEIIQQNNTLQIETRDALRALRSRRSEDRAADAETLTPAERQS